MPRKLRLQYPGAIYHVLSRGDRRENIFYDNVDHHDFLKTLAEACAKTDFQVHAFCLMPNHFHLVLETPQPNLVPGMQWLLSTYTLRLNHRRKQTGHLFSGRYKALLVDGSANSYLKTVCDYVHLNPARAGLLAPAERLLAFPWSSLPWYLTAPEHRPPWIRTERLLGAHGIQHDTPAGRLEFEQHMETRRRSEAADAEWESLQSSWCLGSEQFRSEMLALMETKLGQNHSGALKHQSAEAKAERIIAEELRRLGWTQADLALRLKGDPAKLALANRLRTETILPVTWITQRLHLGTAKSIRPRLRKWQHTRPTPSAVPPQPEHNEHMNQEIDVALL